MGAKTRYGEIFPIIVLLVAPVGKMHGADFQSS